MQLILRVTHAALSACAAIVLLASCSASQGQLSSTVPARTNAAITSHAERGASWMAPGVKASDLLYISDDGTNDVYTYAMTSNSKGTRPALLCRTGSALTMWATSSS